MEQQVNCATRACQLYHHLGAPSMDACWNIITMNAIQDCPVTYKDIKLAHQIFGNSISTLKGQETCLQFNCDSKGVTTTKNDDLCIDTMFINGEGLLTAIDKTIRFRSSIPIVKRTHASYIDALSKIVQHYKKGGFTVRNLYCDMEFESLGPLVEGKLMCNINCANANDHVPEAECND